MALSSEFGNDMQELLRRAEEAMYSVERTGKDAYRVAPFARSAIRSVSEVAM